MQERKVEVKFAAAAANIADLNTKIKSARMWPDLEMEVKFAAAAAANFADFYIH